MAVASRGSKKNNLLPFKKILLLIIGSLATY